MASTRTERRLAAILAADVVGYSRLVEQDEEGTLAALRDIRQQRDRPAAGRASWPYRQADGRRGTGRVRLRGRCGLLCPRRSGRDRSPPGAGAAGAADRVPDRDQPRRRGGRGRGFARGRRKHRRAPGAALRARRGDDLGNRLRPPQGQARPAPRLCGGAARQEHLATRAYLRRQDCGWSTRPVVAHPALPPLAAPRGRSCGGAVAHDRFWHLVVPADRDRHRQALDRRAAVRQSRRRRCDRPSGGRSDRGHHHGSFPVP